MTPHYSGPTLPSRPSTSGRNEVHVQELAVGEGCLGERSQLQDESDGEVEGKWTRAGGAPEGDVHSCSPPTVMPPDKIRARGRMWWY